MQGGVIRDSMQRRCL